MACMYFLLHIYIIIKLKGLYPGYYLSFTLGAIVTETAKGIYLFFYYISNLIA
jgi:hypothetical protein